MAFERWLYRDPADVLDRKRAIERRRGERSKEGRAQRAREGLEELFGDAGMVEHSFRVRVTSDIVSRLENWGWVMRGPKGKAQMSQTGKVCHLMAVQAGAYKYDDVGLPPADEHQMDATAIQRAWMLTPSKQKQLLHLYFIERLDPRACCRSLAIRFREFDTVMTQACNMIENIDRRLASRRSVRDNTITI